MSGSGRPVFAEFLDETEGTDRSLVVVNRTEPEPVQRLLAGSFDGTVFDVESYPEPTAGKLLLTVVSRHVERLAREAGRGTLRSTFQRLSRLDDERGTREVYGRLSRTDLSVHVYGVPDAPVPDPVDATVHRGTGVDYRRSWCVVFTPDDGTGGEHAALVAVETAEGWTATWTYDPERVRAADALLVEAF